MKRLFTINCATVFLMVALRVAIGWHFFQQGLSHKNNPKWSSEVAGFLNQAKGPLAPLYKDQLPRFHDFDRLLLSALPVGQAEVVANPEGKIAAPVEEGLPANDHSAPKPENSAHYGDFYRTVVQDWTAQREKIANFYHFSDEQIKASQAQLDDYAQRLAQVLAGYDADIVAYRHALERNQELAAMPGASEIPNRSARLEKRLANPTAEPGITVGSGPAEWRADVEELDADFPKSVSNLATDDQRKLGTVESESAQLTKIGTAIMWVLIVGGGCLIVGLFTRLSALVLALFLISVICSQPPWVPGTMEIYSQVIECIALLVLATSHVGRWGGLDFFIHHLFLRPLRSK